MSEEKDIVERLMEQAAYDAAHNPPYDRMMVEAASEITRLRGEVERLTALASREGWQDVESAPKDRPFWARKSNGEIALCWRHAPSSRTDEVVTWNGNRAFKAVDWRYPDPLPALSSAPKPEDG